MMVSSLLLQKLASGPFPSDFGEFVLHVFTDGKEEAVVATKGDIKGAENVLCRIQSECLSSHVFFGTICDCREQMAASMRMIDEEGVGIAIFLYQEGRGNGAAAHVATLERRLRHHVRQSEAYEEIGFARDRRDYSIAGKVLQYLQVRSVRLISNNIQKKSALESMGVKVLNLVHYSGKLIILGGPLANLISAVEDGQALTPIQPVEGRPRVFVVGDLNVDYQINDIRMGQVKDKPAPTIGGTGYNAARAFLHEGLQPVLIGQIGDDAQGRFVQDHLKNEDFYSLLAISRDRPTGTCTILFDENHSRLMVQEPENANDYNLEHLRQALNFARAGKDDVIFVVAHAFFRCGAEHGKSLLRVLSKTGAKIVFDVVPHTLYKDISRNELREAVSGIVSVLIAEFPTLQQFLELPPRAKPLEEDYRAIGQEYRADAVIVRFGVGNISRQAVCRWRPDYCQVMGDKGTGYEDLPADEKRGFGDRLTAKFIKSYLRGEEG